MPTLAQTQLRDIVSPEIIERVMSSTRQLTLSNNYKSPDLDSVATHSGVSHTVLTQLFPDSISLVEETFENSWAAIVKHTIKVAPADSEDPLQDMLKLIQKTLHLFGSTPFRPHLPYAFCTYQYMWKTQEITSQLVPSERKYVYETLVPFAGRVIKENQLQMTIDGERLGLLIMASMGRTIQTWNHEAQSGQELCVRPAEYVEALKLVLFNLPPI